VAPEHCIAPGTHDPVQLPELHTYGQTAPLFCQVPPEHDCGWSPEHWVAFCVHEPAHCPALHTFAQGGPASSQVAVAPHS
jgi:hypothetical protein